MSADFGARQTAFNTVRMISNLIEAARADLAKEKDAYRATELKYEIAEANKRMVEAVEICRSLFKLVKS